MTNGDLALGKRRGLQGTATADAIFTVLALDHGVSLAQSIRPTAPETVSDEEMRTLKGMLLATLAGEASAVLLDPIYGLPPAVLADRLPGAVGLLLALEDGDYARPNRTGALLDGWSVAQIKRTGADAVKLFFYYHPDHREEAAAQEALLQAVADSCRDHDIPLFAEPLSYDTPPADRRRIVVETARRLHRLGADVLKLEFPMHPAHEPDEGAWLDACRELSAVCSVPWVLLSAGVDYPTFERQVRIACQGGASGFVAGRAIWKEAVSLQGPALQDHLRCTTRPRLQQLSAIARQYGRPWSDFYPQPAPLATNWYKEYGNSA